MEVPETPKLAGKSSVTLSLIFHVLVILGLVFLAAREGVLGEKFKEIAVVIAPKKEVKKPEKPPEEKKPEEVKKPEEEKKPEPPKEEPKQLAKVTEPKPAPRVPEAPPVMISTPPPPAAIPANFQFSGGGAPVQVSQDPTAVYRSMMEYTLHSGWSYPRQLKDTSLFAEVEVAVSPAGEMSVQNWKHRSGNQEWDASVQRVFQQVRTLRKAPPEGFPRSLVIRFDLVSRQNQILP